MLWIQRGRDDGVEVLAATPGRAPSRVHRIEDQIGGGHVGATLTASPDLALVTGMAYDPPDPQSGFRAPASWEQFVGARRGPLDRILRCPGTEETLRSADAWGEAYVHRACDDRGGHVEIRDRAVPPLSPSRTVGAGGYGARIAGRYVAWIDGPYTTRTVTNQADVVVYDRVLGAEAYRLPRAEVPGMIHGLDVQEDGKVAIAFESGASSPNRVVVGWASPQEPRLHRLPLPNQAEYDVRIAGDRIAFQAGKSQSFTIQRADVGISDLQGRVTRIARNTDASVFGESFDYDGERVVWRELGCERRRLVVRPAAAPGIARGAASKCRLRLLRRPTIKRGVATLRFGCGVFVQPCLFGGTLRTPGRRGAVVGRATGLRENPVRIRLSRPARRALRRDGRLRVSASMRIVDAGGRTQTRRATVTLR